MTYNDLIAEIADDLDIDLSKIDEPLRSRLCRIIVEGQNYALSNCGAPAVEQTLELDGSLTYMLSADTHYIERVKYNDSDITSYRVSPSEITTEE